MSESFHGESPAAKGRRSRTRYVVSGAVGTFVEWYDWFIYGIFAAIFAEQIFPSDNALVSLVAAFTTYAIGFAVRPLGALILSPLGDRIGRRNVLSLTVTMMAGGSLLIGITPSYDSIGILAPVIFILARVLQGLSAGGEVQSAMSFMVEHAPSNRRGLAGSLANVASGAATLLATGLAALLTGILSQPQLDAWGWRVPFLLGAVMGLYGLWLRWRVPETEQFQKIKRAGKVSRMPIREVFRKHPMACLQVAALQATTVAYYIWATFLPTYARETTGRSLSTTFLAGTIGVAAFVVAVPLTAWISDRIKRRKPFVLASALGVVVLFYPLFRLIELPGFLPYLTAVLVGWLLLSMVFGVYPAMFVELFPARLRTTGIGIPYQLTTAVLGGTAPLIGTAFLGAGQPLLVAVYVIAIMLLAGLVYLTLPDRAAEPLDDGLGDEPDARPVASSDKEIRRSEDRGIPVTSSEQP